MAGPPPPRRTVLVVEDDASIRELLRLHLDLAGFVIDEADEGKKALDRARSSAGFAAASRVACGCAVINR